MKRMIVKDPSPQIALLCGDKRSEALHPVTLYPVPFASRTDLPMWQRASHQQTDITITHKVVTMPR